MATDRLSYRITDAFLNPLRAGERIFSPTYLPYVTPLYDFFLYCSAPLGMMWLALHRRMRTHELITPIGFYGAFLVTAFLIVRSSQTWAMHHAVLAFPFLVLSTLSTAWLVQKTITRNQRRYFLVSTVLSFVILNIPFFVRMSTQKLNKSSFPYDSQVLSLLDSDAFEHLEYASPDWGMRLITSIYAKHRENGTPGFGWGNFVYDYWSAREKQTGKEIAVFYNSWKHGEDFLQDAAQHNYFRCEYVSQSEQWQVLVHPHGKLSTICFPGDRENSTSL